MLYTDKYLRAHTFPVSFLSLILAVIDHVVIRRSIWRKLQHSAAQFILFSLLRDLCVVFTKVLSPCGMNECDVVLFCPVCEHLFFCNKAVVVSSSAAFILDVCVTLIRTPGLVVVVGHLLRSSLFPTQRGMLI